MSKRALSRLAAGMLVVVAVPLTSGTQASADVCTSDRISKPEYRSDVFSGRQRHTLEAAVNATGCSFEFGVTKGDNLAYEKVYYIPGKKWQASGTTYVIIKYVFAEDGRWRVKSKNTW